MKTAYELAMERVAKSHPDAGAPLTPERKARLAEVDQIYKGRLAEREIFLKEKLEGAIVAQNAEEFEKIKRQIVDEKARIEEEREAEKEKVRSSPAR